MLLKRCITLNLPLWYSWGHRAYWVLAPSFSCCGAESCVALYKNSPFSWNQQPLYDTELSILAECTEEAGCWEEPPLCSWEKMEAQCSTKAKHKSKPKQLISALTQKKGFSSLYVKLLRLFLQEFTLTRQSKPNFHAQSWPPCIGMCQQWWMINSIRPLVFSK